MDDSKIFIYKVPEKIKDKEGVETPSGLSGEISLRKPSMIEKFQYIEDCGYDVSEDGHMSTQQNKLRVGVKMVQASLAHYKKVDITTAEGQKIESTDSMLYEPRCESILFDISRLILYGFAPSKNLKA